MKETSSHLKATGAHDIPSRVQYWIALPAGLLLACFLNSFYRRGTPPGQLLVRLYDFLLGQQSSLFTFGIIAIPVLLVNLAAWLLHRRSASVQESIFFVVLAILLNAVVIFAMTNVLVMLLVWQGAKP